MRVTVCYSAGTYSGTRSVNAQDSEEAVASVRAWVRKQMTAPMYSESYEVESIDDDPFAGLAENAHNGVRR